MIGHRRKKPQIGRGLGSILSTIFSKIAPIARTLMNVGKKVVKLKPVQNVISTAKNESIKSGLNLLDDVIQGKNVKQSIKANATNVANSVANKALSQIIGSDKKPRPKKRPKKKKKKVISTKRAKSDIFSSIS